MKRCGRERAGAVVERFGHRKLYEECGPSARPVKHWRRSRQMRSRTRGVPETGVFFCTYCLQLETCLALVELRIYARIAA